MANKRQLKKRIAYICGELATEILLAYHLVEGINREDVDKIINEIAELQSDSIAKISFSFDKNRKDFANGAEYHKALKKYNAEAYHKLRDEFSDKAVSIIKLMNDTVPAKARKFVNDLG